MSDAHRKEHAPRKGQSHQDWMEEAFANSEHGKFRRAAEKAGKTTRQFADMHEHDKGPLCKEARLAKAGMEANHKK